MKRHRQKKARVVAPTNTGEQRRVPRFIVDPTRDDESIASSDEVDEAETTGFAPSLTTTLQIDGATDASHSSPLKFRDGRKRTLSGVDPSIELIDGGERASSATTAQSNQARRLRIAQAYLERIGATGHEKEVKERSQGDGSSLVTNSLVELDEGSESTDDDWNDRLYEEARHLRGQYIQPKVAIALKLPALPRKPTFMARGHKRPPTCVTFLTTSDVLEHPRQAITGGKDAAILLWDLESGSKRVLCAGDTTSSPLQRQREILCIAASRDGRLIATGSRDAQIRVYDLRQDHPSSCEPSTAKISMIQALRGHRAAVAGLAFFMDNFQRHAGPNTSVSIDKTNADANLFSASFDRTLRLWSIERAEAPTFSATSAEAEANVRVQNGPTHRAWRIGYVDSYYGHEEEVTSLCCSSWGRLLSTGRDRTVRTWKVYDDTQLVFRAPRRTGPLVGTSIDCVSWVAPNTFVSGADDGSISLWSTGKKKPVHQIVGAHCGAACSWISALCCPMSSNLVCSGSSDGVVRLWNVRMRVHARATKQSSQGTASLPEALEPIGELPYAANGFCNGLDSVLRKDLYIVGAIGQEHRFGKWYIDRKIHNGLVFWRIPLT